MYIGILCTYIYRKMFILVTEIAIGDYGDWNPKLTKAVDEMGDISENSSRVDLRALENRQETNRPASAMSLLNSKIKDAFSFSFSQVRHLRLLFL